MLAIVLIAIAFIAIMIYQSPLQPYGSYEHLSIPQFMTKFNPEETPSDKIVHTDAFNTQPLTYGGLRQSAARIAWGLRGKLSLRQGDIVLALVPNSVRCLDACSRDNSLTRL